MKVKSLTYLLLVLLLLGSHNLYSQQSLYQYLYESGEPLQLQLETRINRLIGAGAAENYQDAALSIKGTSLELATTAEIRTRGNMRKTVCDLPPTKIKLPKTYIKEKGFAPKNKLKLVFPCRNTDQDQQKLFLEHLIYEMYHQLDSNGLRSKVVDIQVTYKGKTRYDFNALMLEDEEAYALRKNARIITKGRLYQDGLERDSWLKLLFFSYMIGNTDWSLPHKHNVELVKLPEFQRSLSLPYDFDYSGLVYQDYAVPNEKLPIKTVRQRYFYKYKMTGEEFDQMSALFNSKKEDILNVISGSELLDDNVKNSTIKYLNEFFDELSNPGKLKKELLSD